ATALAVKKDPAAFDALVRLLQGTKEGGPQRQIIEALVQLGDSRTPDAFLDRIEKDPEGTAQVSELYEECGRFRLPATVNRLLALAGKDKGTQALEATVIVSGFDQAIEDPEDENPDRRWEEKQFPRRTDLLARVLQRAIELKIQRVLVDNLPDARWA